MNTNITPEQAAAIDRLIGSFLDACIEQYGDIETAARKMATYAAQQGVTA